jgi:hypothetical protein
LKVFLISTVLLKTLPMKIRGISGKGICKKLIHLSSLPSFGYLSLE